MESVKAAEFVQQITRNGYGYGSGYGSGDDRKISQLNGRKIYNIDGVSTAIDRVRGGIAKGAILQSNLTFMPCYIVKQDGYFAHGNTLREAMEALKDAES